MTLTNETNQLEKTILRKNEIKETAENDLKHCKWWQMFRKNNLKNRIRECEWAIMDLTQELKFIKSLKKFIK